MKVRFSTVATRGFLFFPARRFDQRVANFQIKVILKESLWDQGIRGQKITRSFRELSLLHMLLPRGGGGGGGDSHMKRTGMLVVSLRGVNFGLWSR